MVHGTLTYPFTSNLPNIKQRRSSLSRLIDPLQVVVPSPTQPTRVLLPRVTRFVCRNEVPIPVFPIRGVKISTSLIGSLFFLPIPSPAINNRGTRHPAIAKRVRSAFQGLAIGGYIIMGLVRIIRHLGLSHHCRGPFIFRSRYGSASVFMVCVAGVLGCWC